MELFFHFFLWLLFISKTKYDKISYYKTRGNKCCEKILCEHKFMYFSWEWGPVKVVQHYLIFLSRAATTRQSLEILQQQSSSQISENVIWQKINMRVSFLGHKNTRWRQVQYFLYTQWQRQVETNENFQSLVPQQSQKHFEGWLFETSTATVQRFDARRHSDRRWRHKMGGTRAMARFSWGSN